METDRRKNFLYQYLKIIKKKRNELPFKIKKEETNINTSSWFDIKPYQTNKVKNTFKLNNSFSNQNIKCLKILMKLNSVQKQTIQKWFNGCTKMYNETVKFIKCKYPFLRSYTTFIKIRGSNDRKYRNFYELRKNLKITRNKINKKYGIYIHVLDQIIKQLCSNIKATETKLMGHLIKRFRIKYWNNSRISKTMTIEKSYLIKNKKSGFLELCPKIFGLIKYMYNKKSCNLFNIKHDVKVNYNSLTNEYLLLIPVKILDNKKNKNVKDNVISIDPGIRTFMTGLSENGLIKIGTNVNKFISDDMKKIHEINDKDISRKIKTKNRRKIERKIKNKVDDLHWKVIKYLTSHYNNILLGDMSAKSILRCGKSVIFKQIKDACERTRFYEFRKRLEYKCNINKVNLKIVNEYYTSKTCSLCGYYNEKLGGNKIYKCNKCSVELDRDMNGCRNIYMKTYME